MAFRIGIIGAGSHGERYLRHGLNDVPGLTVSVVCRRSAGPGRALAAKYGVRYLQEPTAVVADPEVDGVIVCTPPASHLALAEDVLQAGKPLLLEKPMTGTLAEAQQLVRTMRRARWPLMLGQSLRWNPVLRQVRKLWPRLGKVRLVRVAQRLAPTTLPWQRDRPQTVGGSVLLTGVHLFDTVRWLTGAEFISVDSRQRAIFNPVVEDQFLARCVLSDGCWADLEVSKHTQSRACWFEAVGDKGQLMADYLEGGLTLRDHRGTEYFEVTAKIPTLPAVLRDWLGVVREQQAPPVTAHDGLATLRVVDACYRSAAKGKEVGLAADD